MNLSNEPSHLRVLPMLNSRGELFCEGSSNCLGSRAILAANVDGDIRRRWRSLAGQFAQQRPVAARVSSAVARSEERLPLVLRFLSYALLDEGIQSSDVRITGVLTALIITFLNKGYSQFSVVPGSSSSSQMGCGASTQSPRLS